MPKRTKVIVELGNRKAQFLSELPDEFAKHFSYKDKSAFFQPRFRRGMWNGVVTFITPSQYTSTGLFLALREKIAKEMKLKFVVRDRRETLKFRATDYKSDREYQNDATRKMVRASRQGDSGLILGATGIGKTRIAAMYFRRLKGTGVFIVDELQLLYQTKKAMEEILGEKVGVLGDQKARIRRITVATIQTLSKHKKKKSIAGWAKEVDAALIDEVHLALNKRIYQTMLWMKPKIIFGLTATLELQKKEVRLKAYRAVGPVVYEYHLDQAQEEGYLSRGVAVSVVHRQPVRIKDYQKAYRRTIVDGEERNDIIQALVEEAHKRGRSIVVLVERIAHLKDLSERLKEIPHRMVFGEKTVKQRLRAKKRFAKGKIRLIIANKVFKKGIDIPEIDCIVEGSAMYSKNDAIQKFGRGIRLSEGKDGLLYFDISDWSPKGAKKGDPNWNRFQKASNSRRRALKSKGIEVLVMDWKDDSIKILDRAEKALKKK